ncbi:protein mono-ADP-ribosyltransferase PARP9 [Sceloporus undulatus]|uniref:protein mono-ADP-ribosyltransferase PARP9 n=1 Tax=Sceloporus undulatus TaxID=8520 RepID=UPI001C4AF804|nr:protein mono-ADP-ribosyltransferase PARP9 [Sceloporus undulatus]
MGNMMKLLTSSFETTQHKHAEKRMPMDEEILSVPISNNVYAILKRRENYLCSLLQKKFACIAILKTVRNPIEVYKKRLKEGVEVSVWVDDLTRHEADALVNAANEYLHHFGGLAFAVLKAGGPEIEEQCKHFIEKNGPLSAGQIAVTSGGRLHCKQIIHAVGPRWSEGQREECCLKLEAAIINILKYVNAPENNIKSVAIPALSSGIFNFPQDLCAQVIVQTIKNFIQLAPLFGYLQEIHLVNIDEATVEIMRRVCDELLGANDIVSLNGTVESLTVHDICLQIKKGMIERQKGTVIINSVVLQDDHSQGTGTIWGKANTAMKETLLAELHKHPSESPKLIYTAGYNNDCELLVLHVIWPSSSKDNAQEALKTAISKSLFKTQEFPSVSFPPLGIEELNLPKDDVAEIMVEEVIHFAEEHPGKKPEVYIVIPPDDNDVYLAFCTKLMSVKNKLEENMDCSDMDLMEMQTNIQANAGCERNGPSVELIGHSCESLEEAALWLKNIIQIEETHRIIIRNSNILNLGNGQPVELSHLQKHFGIAIQESLTEKGAALEIEGSPRAVIDATFAIEFMLQTTAKQEPLTTDGASGHLDAYPHQEGHAEMTNKYCYQVTPIESYLQEFKDKERQLEKAGLRVLKIEKICNPLLESAFQRIKRKTEGKNTGMPVCHRLYHCVPAQYCSLVCKTGFQKTYSSQDQKYGAGIYFNKNPRSLVATTKEKCEMDHLICLFEAEVVTGSYTRGSRSYVAPPSLSASSMKLYDSVVDDIHNPEIFVIFNREQALPLYLLTCSLLWNPAEKTSLEISDQNL